MPTLEPSMIFGIITAAGTACTILVIIWNDGKTKGEIRQQIIALQKDVLRQNGTDASIIKSIEKINGRFTDIVLDSQSSEERILAAIKKRRTSPARRRVGK